MAGCGCALTKCLCSSLLVNSITLLLKLVNLCIWTILAEGHSKARLDFLDKRKVFLLTPF